MKRFRKAMTAVMIAVIAILLTFTVCASTGTGTNQLGGRIGSRLDLHSAQVSFNSPPKGVPLYDKNRNGYYSIGHYLWPGDWVVNCGSTGDGYVLVTYPITVEQTGGGDEGKDYTEHYVTQADYNAYIIGSAGSFSGDNWNTGAWYNRLPTNIGYTSAKGNNGDTVYVANNTGGFYITNQDSNGYSRLWTGDMSARVMYASVSQYCYYDSSHSDFTNADYAWNLTGQNWSTDGLNQGRNNTVYYAGMDLSGNWTQGSRTIWWDTIAPIVTNSLQSVMNQHSGWINASDTGEQYTISGRDNNSQTNDISGLHNDSLQINADNRGWSGYQGFSLSSSDPTATSTHSYSVGSLISSLGDGVHDYKMQMMDYAGNEGSADTTVKIDTVPPTVRYSPASKSWTNQDINVTVTPSDSLSGVASYKYSIGTLNSDGSVSWGAWSSLVNNGNPFTATLSAQNQYYIKTYCTDNAGNSSTTQSGLYQIDKTPPTVSYSPDSCGWTNKDVTVTVTPSDTGGSGVNYYKYRISLDGGITWGDWGSNITGDANTNITLDKTGFIVIQTYIADNAGNENTLNSGVYHIDKISPTVQYQPSSSPWTNQTVSVKILPSDTGGSGVKQYQYRTSSDNGSTWSAWSDIIEGDNSSLATFNNQGIYLIQSQIADNAGNTATITSGQYLIDKTLPNVTYDPYSYTTTQPMISVSLFLSDKGGSGLKYSRYRIENNGVWGDWSPTLPGSPVTAKNLLTSSDFSSGITGWSCYNNNTGLNVIGASNGEGYLAPDSKPSLPIYNEYLYQKVNAVVGHKYFLRATVHSNSPANGAEITTQFKDSTDWPSDGAKTEEADTTLTKSMYTGNGSYQTLYLDSIAAPANSASLWVTLENTKSNTTNQPEYMDNVVLVDLTATFGSGNEPTADQFNSMFPNYFSDTSTYSGIDFGRAPNVIINKTGTNVIQTEVTDNAGNVNTVNSGNYVLLGEQVNDNPPTMTFSPDSAAWTNQNVNVTMTPHDDLGIDYFTYRVSPDGGNTWGSWSSPIYGGSSFTTALTDTGQYKLETFTADTTGHTVYSYSGVYQIDKIAPTASCSPNSADYTGSASILITPSDTGGSGVKQWRYRISTDGSFDTESWSPYYSTPSTITINTNLDAAIQTEVTDNAGNVGTVISGTYHKITGNLSGIVEVSDHYYENTDVTGAVVISYTGIGVPDLTPSSGVTVKITAGDSVSTQTILCPANNQSYIPFKFRTPDNQTDSGIPLNIKVEIDPDNKLEETSKADNVITKTITIDSAKFTEPSATTYQPTAPSTWKGVEAGTYPSTNTLNWQEWRYENNALVLKSFYVNAAASFQLTSDSRAASSTYDAASNLWTMRSGYGFSNSTTVHVTTNYDNPDLITLPQRIRVYFPEFDYDQQNNLRELEQTSETGSATDYTVKYEFKQNPQSRTLARLHFTPLWFKDGDYVVLENARDIWTPGGQLNMWGTDKINISGSVYDDWHAGLIPNN